MAGETLAEDLKWAHEELTNGERLTRYARARDYYNGNHDLKFASEKFQNTYGQVFAEFAYNRCAPVIDAISDRLQLIGMEVAGATTDDSGAESSESETDSDEAAISAIWEYNRMDKRQGDIHAEALTAGDAYVIVWPETIAEGTSEQMPRFYVNGAGSMVVYLDEESKRKMMAVKAWRLTRGPDKNKWRLTFYYPDRIEKYISTGKPDDMPKEASALVPYIDPLTKEPWPVINPFGQVPVFWFANRAPEGQYGKSELRDAMPLQDALNKSVLDLMVAMEYGAYKQRYVTGLNLGMPDPLSGKPKMPFRQGPGEIWSGPAGANFGEFDTTDLTQFLKVRADFDGMIANVVRIPQHWLTMTGTPPSGEAYKTAESPFVGKLQDMQIDFSPPHEDAFKFALLTMGREISNLKAIWKNAELRSERETAEVSEIKSRYDVPPEQLWKETGYTASEIEEFKAIKEEAVANAQRAINAGQMPALPTNPNEEE